MCPVHFNAPPDVALPPLNAFLNDQGPIRSRLRSLWNSADQNNLRLQLVGVDRRQAEFCVQTATGGPLLYVSRELVNRWEHEEGNNPLFRAALEAAVAANTRIRPSSGRDTVEFLFTQDGVTHRAKLEYESEQYKETATGWMATQGKVTDIKIDRPMIHEIGSGSERRNQKRPVESEDSIDVAFSSKRSKTEKPQNESRRFLDINQQATPQSAGSTSGSSSRASAPSAPAPAPAVSTQIASGTPSDKWGLFGVIAGTVDPSKLPTHQSGIQQLLARQSISANEIYAALFPEPPLPPGSSQEQAETMRMARRDRRNQFDSFAGFLSSKQKTLSTCLNDLKTFGEMRQEYMNENRSAATARFMNELREACFYLPTQELAAKIGPNCVGDGSEKYKKLYEQLMRELVAHAGRLDEIFAMMGVSIVSVIASKDKPAFQQLMHDIKAAYPTDSNLKSVLDKLHMGYML